MFKLNSELKRKVRINCEKNDFLSENPKTLVNYMWIEKVTNK